MKHFLIALAFGTVLACSSCGGGATDAAPEKEISGQAIYESNCMSCHGHDGKKGMMNAPDLSAISMDADSIRIIVTNGKGVMAPFSSLLSEEEIRAVAQYVKSLKGK